MKVPIVKLPEELSEAVQNVNERESLPYRRPQHFTYDSISIITTRINSPFIPWTLLVIS